MTPNPFQEKHFPIMLRKLKHGEMSIEKYRKMSYKLFEWDVVWYEKCNRAERTKWTKTEGTSK